MDIQSAVKICFQKYVDFNGRAARPEFWWFFLFCLVVSFILGLISNTLSSIFSFATLIPTLAVGARRLHDTNKTGWLQLAWYISFFAIAFLMWAASLNSNFTFMAFGVLLILASIAYMVYLMAKVGDATENKYGDVPTN
jgi:uncharacterized membrane protein YhaH (DUF805 family)